MLRNLFLMEIEITQARSELMKQEHKVESLNNFINELQPQAYAQRLEVQDAHHGCVEFRREQVRLQEELVLKEKALRVLRCSSFFNHIYTDHRDLLSYVTVL